MEAIETYTSVPVILSAALTLIVSGIAKRHAVWKPRRALLR
ncbi:MAG TPA: hypothetical protein VJ689_07500 [Gaiellaceae bacterium]|jgi:hypothetical protein|nr:hypothetical protein [Gaiellaceae bacterium]